jgi:heptosyltransferase-3
MNGSSETIVSHPDPARIVIVHQGALGDFILALPAFEGIHHNYPDARIDFWSKPEHVALIADKFYFGEVRSCGGPELSPFFHDTLWQEANIPAFFQNARAVFVFGQSGSRILAERLANRTGNRVFWVRSFPDAGSEVSVSEAIIAQMRRLGFEMELSFPALDCPDQEREMVRSVLARRSWLGGPKPLLMHPGSGARKKVWPLSRWWALLHWLQSRRDCRIVMTLGPADDYLRPFVMEAERRGVLVLDSMPLPRLVALMKESVLYIGVDSGVSHLAAASGVPSVVIFGPTEARIWAPRGPTVRVVQSSWEEEEVLAWSPSSPISAEIGEIIEQVESEGRIWN